MSIHCFCSSLSLSGRHLHLVVVHVRFFSLKSERFNQTQNNLFSFPELGHEYVLENHRTFVNLYELHDVCTFRLTETIIEADIDLLPVWETVD